MASLPLRLEEEGDAARKKKKWIPSYASEIREVSGQDKLNRAENAACQAHF